MKKTILFAMFLASAAGAKAEIIDFVAHLSGPPPAFYQGSGTADFTLDTSDDLFTCTSGIFRGLTSPATSASVIFQFVLPATPGANPLDLIPSIPLELLVASNGRSGTFSGSATVSSFQAAYLLQGVGYADVRGATTDIQGRLM